jgi:hypothetical protein
MMTLFRRSTSASTTAVAAAILSLFEVDKISTRLFDACLYILGRDSAVGVTGTGTTLTKLGNSAVISRG